MAKYDDTKATTGVAVLAHPAARAWAQLRPGGPELVDITLLKHKGKSAIYRLTGLEPSCSAVVAKKCLRETARVEKSVYAEVLARLPVASLRYYGYVEDPEGVHGWLFLEECVAEKYSPTLEEHRRLAGRWLGLLHTSAAPLAGNVSLPDRGPSHFWQCLYRVRNTIAGNRGIPMLGVGDVAVLEDVLVSGDAAVARWGKLEQLCARMPRTLVHGDFIKRNLRVRPGPSGPTLVAFDWEIAGWGIPAIDLVGPPFSGRPDLTAYWEVVREHWSAVDLSTVQRWAQIGSLFRFLAAAEWAVMDLVQGSVEKSVSKLAIYRNGLVATLRVLGWEK